MAEEKAASVPMDQAEQRVAGVRAAYDAVARAYARTFGDELARKPLDRALLAAIVELAGTGAVADVGCGPGHVTRFLAERHEDVLGIDLSPAMVALAREQAPGVRFAVGSLLALPAEDAAWAGAVALYSIIHLTGEERVSAYRELARVLRPGGWLLVAFHVDSPDFSAGEVNHVKTFLGENVELDGYFLDPGEVAAQLDAAGLAVTAEVIRQADPEVEYPSRRCYLLAHRR